MSGSAAAESFGVLAAELKLDIWAESDGSVDFVVSPVTLEALQGSGQFSNLTVLIDDLERQILSEKGVHDENDRGDLNLQSSSKNFHESFHKPEGMVHWLITLQQKHPRNAQFVTSIGKSAQGRDIFAFKIAGRAGFGRMPVVMITSLFHAREWYAAEPDSCIFA